MKILIENRRLKASIDTMKNDIDKHKRNELKIASILKESKTKIVTFKDLIKDKSRKISQITENNIELKGKVGEMEEKINQLNSYSIWQEGQIRDLKKQLSEEAEREGQEKVLQEKLGKLEIVLKNYEIQMIKSEEKENTESKGSYSNDYEG